ncbi:hypothetical protein WAI453_008042 [Rhynchosporium graminicola]
MTICSLKTTNTFWAIEGQVIRISRDPTSAAPTINVVDANRKEAAARVLASNVQSAFQTQVKYRHLQNEISKAAIRDISSRYSYGTEF